MLREAQRALVQAPSDIANLRAQLGETQQLLKATQEAKREAELTAETALYILAPSWHTVTVIVQLPR